MPQIVPILELLNKDHKIEDFKCGHEFLNIALKSKALAAQDNYTGRTYVLVGNPLNTDESAVIGYFTLKAEAQSVMLPDQEQPSYIPLIEIEYLARDLSVRGRGIGGVLLIQALSLCYQASKIIGVAGVYLTATSEGRTLYEKEDFGFYIMQSNNHYTEMFVPMRQVKAILDALEKL